MGLIIFIIVCVVISIIVVAIVHDGDRDPLTTTIVAIICFGTVAFLGVDSYLKNYANEHTAVCHVNSKDRGGKDGSYRIYTEDCGVLSNRDSFLRGKFNSADVWNQIPESGTVEVRIAGTRVPPFSIFPNVMEVNPITE